MRRRCEICGRVIPRERLTALPETKRCVKCSRENGSGLPDKRVDVGMDPDTYRDLLGATRS